MKDINLAVLGVIDFEPNKVAVQCETPLLRQLEIEPHCNTSVISKEHNPRDRGAGAYMLHKPVAFNQPNLAPNKQASYGTEMLSLLTNTTIHLHTEAKRL